MEKTAQTNLLLLEKKDFIETELYNDVLKDVFDTGRFFIKIPENQIEFLFDNKKEANNDFKQYDVEIEDLYVDLESSFIKSMVVSFYDKKGRLEYGLIVNYPYKRSYELMYTNSDYKKIKAKDAERCLFNPNIAKGIIKRLAGETLDSLLFLKYDIQFTSERLFYFSGNKASDEFFDLLELVLAKKFGVRTDFDYVLNTLIVDVQDMNNPILVCVEFTYEEKPYKYWIESDELNEISELDNGKDDASFIDAFLDVAMQDFVNDKSNLILERQAQEIKNNAFNFFKTRYKKLKEIKEDAFGFEELDGEPFIFFSDDSVSINTSRNNETTGAVTYFYDELEANATEIKRVIDRYFNTRSIKYDTFINDGNKYLESSYDLEEAIKAGSELLKRADTFCDADRSQKLFSSLLNKIEEKHSKFLNIDKEKVSKTIGLINKIKDLESYEKYCDDLNDAIDDLGEGELAAIKSQYDTFLNTFGNLSKYDSQTVYRSVFIRKSVLEQLKKIDDDEKDLNIIHILDEIVDKLKTTPGNQLGRYLLNKGLNFPIKADRSVKKIRIMRHAKYRLLFVYGSDLDLDERLYNCDSIFIFAVTKHDKNKKELYNLAETKPNKYRIGDFIIYSNDKYLNMPECTLDQYKIAAEIENHPIVTFGCAGSGKTTVSIEKYKNIVYNEYGCVSPASDKLVYITFHKRLSERSKKELDEYKVNGNCCKLTDYFAYVLGDLEEKDAFCQNESDNKEKKELSVLTELTFIEWFRKEYSQEEIKNNKRGRSFHSCLSGVKLHKLFHGWLFNT